LKEGQKMKLGLALAGGGVKGAAHIGVIKALEENGIKPEAVAGTSIGSIVAALYSMGYSTEKMLEIFKYFAKSIMKTDSKYFVENIRTSKKLLGYGLISGENTEIAIKECAKQKNIKYIQDIKMPISIPTVDIVESKKYVFTNMNFDEDYYINDALIGKAVRASSSYPRSFCTM
jgi:NTE family protein